MVRQFHAQLEAIRQKVLHMGALAREQVLEGVDAFMAQDEAKAKRVIDREHSLNVLDVEIERDLLDLVALHQPVAQDLRTIGASLKIITYVDRIGRYGYDIAQTTSELKGREPPRKPVAIRLMAERAIHMLDEAMAAYKDRDAERARAVRPKDEVVDGLNEQTFRDCLTTMMEDPRMITTCAHLILVARHLERVADLSCKVAEKTLYMATGERRLQV